MKVRFKGPELNGKTPQENIAKLDTYLNDLAMKLDYIINNLDDDNMVNKPVHKEELKEEITKSYEQIRAYVVSLKGDK